jgi:antitoxin component of MazEF toxin-antitoxin module
VVRIVVKSRLKGVEKLTTVGNSLGMCLPKTALKMAGWKKGDLLEVNYSEQEDSFTIKNLSKKYAEKHPESRQKENGYFLSILFRCFPVFHSVFVLLLL